jgi:cell division septum initiation protein DivIVA
MFFVERLEGMLANGKRLPLTSNVVVDQAAALELIDELRHAIPEEVQAARRVNAEGERILERASQEAEQIVVRAQEQAAFLIDEQGLTEAAALELIDELRHAIPEEVQAARRVNAEGERILERAGQEAERIVAHAQEQAAYLIGEQGLTEAAEIESRRIIGEAEADAAGTRRGADEYAADVLIRLESEVSRVLGQIERGIDALGVRAEPEPVPGSDEEGAEPAEG